MANYEFFRDAHKAVQLLENLCTTIEEEAPEQIHQSGDVCVVQGTAGQIAAVLQWICDGAGRAATAPDILPLDRASSNVDNPRLAALATDISSILERLETTTGLLRATEAAARQGNNPNPGYIELTADCEEVARCVHWLRNIFQLNRLVDQANMARINSSLRAYNHKEPSAIDRLIVSNGLPVQSSQC
jgi:hypothetical protein